MAYIVTHTNPHPGPAGIDVRPGGFDLDGALAHACELLTQGLSDVAIQDGSGRSIRGADLVACCRGEKKLTADLQAVSN
jgi:hypothetical protein